MFVSLLLPYIDRGYGPLFHWVMLRQLESFGPGDIAFIADERYFCRPAPWGEEMEMLGFAFRCPTELAFQTVRKAALPCAVFDDLDRRTVSMLEAYRVLLTEDYPPLRQALLKILKEWDGQGRIDAVLTWCNLPSLSAAAAELGVPVIHNELGPLRQPHYQPTVYFDFQGVNGRTSARAEMQRFAGEVRQTFTPLSPARLRELLLKRADAAAPSASNFPVGVALQVEDDSNLLAFANGRSNFELIYAARKRWPADQVLVRAHPHGHLEYRPKLGVRDESPDSATFIASCQTVWTLNSSVAFECLLREKPVRILGDSPAAALGLDQSAGIDAETRLLWLNYLFLGYLVPAAFLFDPEYYRWRLTHPSLEEICRKHLDYYEEEAVLPEVKAAGVTLPEAEPAQAPAIPATRYSFLETLSAARVVQGKQEQTGVWEATIGGQSSAAVYLQPPAQLLFEVPTGAAGVLSTAVCLHPDVWDKSGGGGCEFHLRIDGRLAFVVAIDPIHHAEDRRWHSLQLPVPASSEGRHHILLETRSVGTNNDFRWALWRDPVFSWETATPGEKGQSAVLTELARPAEGAASALSGWTQRAKEMS